MRTLPMLVRALPMALVAVLVLAVPALAAEVRLTDDGFEPDTVTVTVGETITWVNDTDDEQTIAADDGRWDSGPLQPGESFSIALRVTGTTAYSADDGEVTGEVVVEAAADEDDDAADEDAEVEDTEDETLPTTGLPAVALLGLALGLLGGGTVLLRRFA